MMPLIKTAVLCQKTQLLIERSKLELTALQERHLQTYDYIETGRIYLQTARWSLLSQSHELQAGPAFSLPTIRGAYASWNKRAQETRCFAQRIEDAGVKRELMDLAEQYDRLGDDSPAVHVPSHVDAIAA